MVDYSKWDHIEISDDEDDTHPNIDTASLFRWRHQARIEKMEQSKKEKEDHYKQRHRCENNLNTTRVKIAELVSQHDRNDEELTYYKDRLTELESEMKQLKDKEKEMLHKEKSAAWNVDTISQDGFQKTVINKPNKEKKQSVELSEEEKSQLWEDHINNHREELEKFGEIDANWRETQRYLVEKPLLLCEETANFLALWCIDLELEEDKKKLDRIAFHTVTMHFILELAKQLNTEAHATVGTFFKRIQKADKQYLDAFLDELRSFKDRVRDRAQARINKAKEEERQKRLGPGGLDPVEVFECMPPDLKECFETKDTAKLQDVLCGMPKAEAEDWLQKAVASGLWIPNKDEETEREPASSDSLEHA